MHVEVGTPECES